MQIGTAEPIVEEEPPLKKKGPRRSGGIGPGSRNGGNGGNDDDNGGKGGRGNDFPRAEEPDVVPDKAKVVTWFLLLVVLMTFGGLIGSYIVIATNDAIEWQPFALPVQVWISTAVILASTVTYELARRAVFANHQLNIQRFMIATTVLGGVFISSQLLAWLALVDRGLYMSGNPYAGFFYILTAAHAIHVLGGIVALGAILLRCWYPTGNSDELQYRRNLARSVGWYWHFMGVLWIVLFLLLGFWK
ncbi:MAG TPA: cytochrome c oxidase subunit 3 [Pyrinomonadaceae bacterium]|nr:cytochrome c oxidase subunit 3 [Pyrinomonadaceae bacterium]